MNQTPTPVFAEPDLVGIHNADLAKSTVRILEGGSWKKQDTIILLPTAKMVPMKCAVTWMNMIRPPNQSCPPIPIFGMEVGDAYSTAIQHILAHPQLATHRFILTIEHDNAVPQDGLLRLLKHMEAHPELHCIGGLYWTKGPGGVPQIWGDKKDPLINFRPQPPDPNGGLVECWGTGMGFNLWRTEMFAKLSADPTMPKPIFKTKASLEEGVGTQDLAFWGEAQKRGFRCAVACDVTVGHYDVNTDTMF